MRALDQTLIEFLTRHAVDAHFVGGAVRDRLLGRAIHDFDLVVAGDALALARQLADHLRGAYVPLDVEHATGRVVLRDAQVDVGQQRGGSLIEDLRLRDFTVNAMAIPAGEWAEPQPTLIDPTDGQTDLRDQTIRAVSAQTFEQDPARLLRAVRLSAQLDFAMDADTRRLVERDAGLITRVSWERLRDELWHCLTLARTEPTVRALNELGLLAPLLPELALTKGVTQRPPHTFDVHDHSLAAMTELERVLAAVGVGGAPPDPAAERHLAPYAPTLRERLLEEPVPGRPRWTLMKLLALLHDIGKPPTRTVKGDIAHFYRHEAVGAEMIEAVGRRLKLSGREVQWLVLNVRHHLRPLQLSQLKTPSARSLYRFFRDLGEAAVDVLLLSIGDNRAKADRQPIGDKPDRALEFAVEMLALQRSEEYRRLAAPPTLVTGNDLIRDLGLPPGPRIGELLEAVREATATGRVSNREEALRFARQVMATDGRRGTGRRDRRRRA
jgi:tRNA nucleotidyltransferase/poly(A) polymerase